MTDKTDTAEQDAPEPSPIATMLEALAADTPEEEIHKRLVTNKAGQPVMKDGAQLELSYVTARYVQDRLDDVVGPQDWENRFETLANGAVRCGIGITFHGADTFFRTVWKYDVGIPSSIEPDKGAHSDAFKRAGVMWGIARDLYDERDDRVMVAPEAPGVPAQAPQVPIRERVVPTPVVEGSNIVEYDPDTGATSDPMAQWVCPIHDDAREVPAGISKRTLKPYPAFFACPVAGCDEKEPFKRR